MIFRMLKKGPVEVELDIKNAVSKKPVEVYNTVAELKGTEKPGEVVILGGHLDSLDLAFDGRRADGCGLNGGIIPHIHDNSYGIHT